MNIPYHSLLLLQHHYFQEIDTCIVAQIFFGANAPQKKIEIKIRSAKSHSDVMFS